MRVRVDDQDAAQAYKVHDQAARAGIKHGSDVRVDIEGLAVFADNPNTIGAFFRWLFRLPQLARVRFCGLNGFRVRKVTATGKGKNHRRVTLQDLNIDTEGEFRLENARMVSNGALRIIVDKETRVHRGRRIPLGVTTVG